MGNCLGTSSSPHIIWGSIPGKFRGKYTHRLCRIGYRLSIYKMYKLYFEGNHHEKLKRRNKKKNFKRMKSVSKTFVPICAYPQPYGLIKN